MDKVILIASDLTARGDRPFARAAILAQHWDAKRVILFANADRSRVKQEAVEKQLRRSFAEALDDCEVLVAHGKVPDTIARTSKNIDADLVVVGAARHNNVTDFFLGTAIDFIVRHNDRPVLVVKERPHHDYRNIMIAVDFSPASSHAVKTALDFFPNVKVTLAHTFDPPYKAWLESGGLADELRKEAEAGMDGFVQGLNLNAEQQERITTILLEGAIHQALYEEMEKRETDLLVLGTHGRSGFVQATIGSRAAEMLNWAPSDVLMIRGPK